MNTLATLLKIMIVFSLTMAFMFGPLHPFYYFLINLQHYGWHGMNGIAGLMIGGILYPFYGGIIGKIGNNVMYEVLEEAGWKKTLRYFYR